MQALLQQAQQGDIHAFQALFAEFQDSLKAYLYRLLANRNDAEDLTHDTFIRAFDKIGQYRGKASLKSWTFRIATSLAYNYLQRRNRWSEDVNAQAKDLVINNTAYVQFLERTSQQSHGQYEIREHIDTCFTCLGKTLPIAQQIALILKDVYAFSVPEIQLIMDQSEGQVKYLLQKARKAMIEIFERRCALVSKKGVCHQCSELNGWFNPKQDQQAARMKIKLVRE
ncbi:MAG: RNA polymerase sigma factor, partial [Bacteroidota bacterium]